MAEPNFKKIGALVVKKFINSSSSEAVTRHRYGASTTVDFRRAQGEKASTPALRVYIPPVASRSDRRAEGTRRAGEITVYSIADFRAADEKAGTRADELERADGTVYTIEAVNDYFSAGGFYESTAVLLNRGPA